MKSVEGIHPLEHKKEQKANQSNTVQTLVEAWYKNYIEKNRKQPLQVKQQIQADIIPLLGDRSLDIDPVVIEKWAELINRLGL